MPEARIGGMLKVSVNGEILYAKGEFTYSLGLPLKSGIVGQDTVHGYTEKPQLPFIEGTITWHSGMSLTGLVGTKDATVTLELANSKTIALYKAWYADTGEGTSGENEVKCRFESKAAEEI
jgi:hypothetical protein